MSRKILTALLIVLSLFGVSQADIVYTTSEGNLGIIPIIASYDVSAPSIQYRSSITEPMLSSYWNGTSTNIILIDRNKTASGDRAYIFNPEDMTNFAKSSDLAGVHGAEHAAYADNGRSIFLTAGSSIFDVDTSLLAVRNSFDCLNVYSNDNFGTSISNIAVGYNSISVLTETGEIRKLLRFDGQLKKGVSYFFSADVHPETSCLSIVNTVILFGHSEGVDGLNVFDQIERVLSTDYPVVALCPDEDKGFYFATLRTDSSGTGYTFLVAHSANTEEVQKLEPVTINSSLPTIKLIRDTGFNSLAIMTAEGILIFDMKTGLQTAGFNTTALGGQPTGIAAAAVSGSSNKSGSSGCNSLGTGLVLTALIGMMIKRK